MIARNRIWEELKQAKANILCLQKYTDNRRAWSRWYNGIIAFVASFGAIGYSLDEIIPFITSIIVGIASIAKSIAPTFLQTAQDLSELDTLCDFYVRYMNSLEKIWYDLDHNVIDDDEAMNRFFILKETECDKESIYNRGVRNISKKLQNKVDEQAEEYINRVYFEKEKEE
mgnify:CR=1 FL=1